MFSTNIQGTVLIISRDPLCEDSNVRFTILPLKPLNQYCGRYCRFKIGFPTQVNFTCAQLRALVTPKNSRTVACNSTQLRATELRLETLIGNANPQLEGH